MRTSTLFTIASLFLISSFSLPQPENLEASRSIEDREAHHGKPGFPEGHEWPHGGSSSSSNSTKIKEREAHHEKPGFPEGHEWPHGGSSSSSNSTKIKEREAHHGKPWDGHGFPPHGPPTSTNTTKLKERQHGAPHGPPGGDEYPPWGELTYHTKHKGSRVQSASSPGSTGGVSSSSEGSGSGNSTKVKMVKFRD